MVIIFDGVLGTMDHLSGCLLWRHGVIEGIEVIREKTKLLKIIIIVNDVSEQIFNEQLKPVLKDIVDDLILI